MTIIEHLPEEPNGWFLKTFFPYLWAYEFSSYTVVVKSNQLEVGKEFLAKYYFMLENIDLFTLEKRVVIVS